MTAAPGADAAPDVEDLLGELLAVRGATVAAIVDGGGAMVAGRANDPAAMQRAAAVVTTALAAGAALGELLPSGPGDAGDARPRQVMVSQDAGPMLFVPLRASDHVVVVALRGEGDVGRARLAVKTLLPRFAERLGGRGEA